MRGRAIDRDRLGRYPGLRRIGASSLRAFVGEDPICFDVSREGDVFYAVRSDHIAYSPRSLLHVFGESREIPKIEPLASVELELYVHIAVRLLSACGE